jgi:hypothetical protein
VLYRLFALYTESAELEAVYRQTPDTNLRRLIAKVGIAILEIEDRFGLSVNSRHQLGLRKEHLYNYE